jgi:hypothetical protein
MKNRYAVLMLSAWLSGTIAAEDLTTADGTVYTDIKISEITPIGINFVSADKASWVDFRDLTPETAKKYGYNQEKAEAFEKQLTQNQAVPAGNVSKTATAAVVTPPAAVSVSTQAASVSTPVAAVRTAPSGITVATPPAVVNVNPQSVSISTPVVNAAVSSAPDGAGISITTPIAAVTIGTPMPPPAPARVVVVRESDPVVFDEQIVYEPVTVNWVMWNGRYYPRYWWHYNYWSNRYVSCGGRYYPALYYYHSGRWHGGRYYNYSADRYPARGYRDYNRGQGPQNGGARSNYDRGQARQGGNVHGNVQEYGQSRQGNGERSSGYNREPSRQTGSERAGNDRGQTRQSGGERGRN